MSSISPVEQAPCYETPIELVKLERTLPESTQTANLLTLMEETQPYKPSIELKQTEPHQPESVQAASLETPSEATQTQEVFTELVPCGASLTLIKSIAEIPEEPQTLHQCVAINVQQVVDVPAPSTNAVASLPVDERLLHNKQKSCLQCLFKRLKALYKRVSRSRSSRHRTGSTTAQ